MSSALKMHPGSKSSRKRPDPFRLGWRFAEVPGPDGEPITKQIPLTEEDVLHPQEEDSIVNTPLHNRLANYLRSGIQTRFENQKKVVVLGDCRVDWQVRQGWAHGTDVAVFFDVKKKSDETKGTFKVKTMGGRCVLIIEVTSPSTRGNDYGVKMREYFSVGVRLYVIVDVPEEGESGPINLYGFQAGEKQFEPLPPDDKGRLGIEFIGLWLGADGLNVYLEDAGGNRVPDLSQAVHTANAETKARKKAESRAKDAEARVRELEAELAKTRAKNQS